MMHDIDITVVRESQDTAKQCGWVYPVELHNALELYGLPINSGESRAVARYLVKLNRQNVCMLDDLLKAISHYVVY